MTNKNTQENATKKETKTYTPGNKHEILQPTRRNTREIENTKPKTNNKTTQTMWKHTNDTPDKTNTPTNDSN